MKSSYTLRLVSVLTIVIIAASAVEVCHGQIPTFAKPREIISVGTTWGSAITAEGREMYITDWNSDNWNLRRVTRPSTNDPWPNSLGTTDPVLSSASQDDEISFTSDGLTAVFNRNSQLYQATRTSFADEWSNVTNLKVNGWAPSVSPDGLTVYYTRNMWTDTIADIYIATRDSINDPFDFGEPVESINTPNFRESSPHISTDGLSMYFVSDRPGGEGLEDIWMASRTAIDTPFGEAANLGPSINSANSDWSPFVTDEGVLYYTKNAQRGVCCWSIWEADPNDRYREIGGAGATGQRSLPGTQSDAVFREVDGVHPGLLQRWYSIRNPRTFGRVKSRVFDPAAPEDGAPTDVPPIGIEGTWWTGSQDAVPGLLGYPAELTGANRVNDRFGNNWNIQNNDDYTVVLTGEILIPESGTYKFLDGIDDYAAFGIDVDGDGTVDEGELIIDDNDWTSPDRVLNDGGLQTDFVPEMVFDNIGTDGQWFQVLAVVGEGTGADSGIFYWDYDATDQDSDGIRIGDAKGFPESPNGEGRTIETSDIPSLLIPDSHLRSEGRHELVSAVLTSELDPDLFGYELEISDAGDSDSIVVEDPTGRFTTRLDLNDATIALAAIGDPKPGEYQLFDADAIFGNATLVIPEELAAVFDTSRLLLDGILTVLSDLPFDCNGDGILDVHDLNCTGPEQLATVIAAADLIQGDADGDGAVTFDDFLTLSGHFGQSANYTDGDFNRDGTVAFADFLILSANFGKASAFTATVPEPTGLVLSLIAVTGLVSCHRRRR